MKCRFTQLLILTAALALFMTAQQQVAFAQAGSTGGVIGKQDKSISGGEGAAEPRALTKPSRPIERGASDRSSVAGRWRWTQDCSGGGLWKGEFDLAESAGGQISGSFAGTSWHDIGTITGQINGNNLSFTRKNAVTTQYWKGRVGAGRISGTSTGSADCSWQAMRK